MVARWNRSDTAPFLTLWIESIIAAHPFIDERYWHASQPAVHDIYLPAAQTWVWRSNRMIQDPLNIEALASCLNSNPSVILYESLPEDLLHRLQELANVTQVPGLNPATVQQHAEAFASAEGLLGSSENVDAALLEKMPKLRAHLGFGMPILYNARRHHPEAEKRFNARYWDLDTLLQEADFICLVLPLTAETHHLIGAKQFASMKSSAIFINAGRGPVVDEQALIAALKNGQIHAAGLDVFEQEPLPASSELLSLPNPHIGSATHETRHNMATCAVDNLFAALGGNMEENCVNPEVAGK